MLSKKKLKALWVLADPLEKLKLGRDSTLFWLSLMKNQKIFWIESLGTEGVKFSEFAIFYSQYNFESEPEIILGPPQECSWAQMAGKLLFRLDPPVDARYRIAASLLAIAAPPGLQVINNPLTAVALSEKLLPLLGKDEIPFRLQGSAQKGDVLKSVWGFGGADVRRVSEETHVIAEGELSQEFDPEISQGERRLYYVNSSLHGVLEKTPSPNEFRSNYQWGAKLLLKKATAFEIRKTRFYQKWLRARGIQLATVDFIGKRIVEVNITCPGLLYPTCLLEGFSAERDSRLSRELKKLAKV